MTLTAAAVQPPAAVDRFCCPRSGSLLQQAFSDVDRQDRQTDGRTDTRLLHSPCTAYYAGRVDSATADVRQLVVAS